MALALVDPEGRVLLQQRSAHKHHADLWEFPGGKLEPGETPRLALVREIAEELAIVIDPDELSPAGFAEEAGRPPVCLLLYRASRWRGQPTGLQNQAIAWLLPDEAARYPLAPMDAALLRQFAGTDAGEGTLAKPGPHA